LERATAPAAQNISNPKIRTVCRASNNTSESRKTIANKKSLAIERIWLFHDGYEFFQKKKWSRIEDHRSAAG